MRRAIRSPFVVTIAFLVLPLVVFTCGAGALLVLPLAAHAVVRAARGDWYGYPLLGSLSL